MTDIVERDLNLAEAPAFSDTGVVDREAYFLSPEQMDGLEAELFAQIEPQLKEGQDIVAVVVPWDSKFADFGRTSETIAYGDYDNHNAMQDYEQHSLFVFTYDTDHGKVGHVKRLVLPKTPEERHKSGLTGIEIIDDRLRAGIDTERLDLQTIFDAHDIASIEQCINVTSNHRTKRLDTEFLEKPYVLVSYKAVFQLVDDANIERLFAYLNPKAVKSLGQMGLEWSMLADGQYHLPDAEAEGGYDTDYNAVVIPHTQHNVDVFTKLDPDNPATALIAERDVPMFTISDGDDGVSVASLR